MKYPPIDPKFYEVDANSGMDEDEIKADWEAFCDGLDSFQGVKPQPSKKRAPLRDILKKIIKSFTKVSNGSPQNH